VIFHAVDLHQCRHTAGVPSSEWPKLGYDEWESVNSYRISILASLDFTNGYNQVVYLVAVSDSSSVVRCFSDEPLGTLWWSQWPVCSWHWMSTWVSARGP